MTQAPVTIDVDAVAAGTRLDVMICRCTGLSRKEAAGLLASGGVAVNGKVVSERAKGVSLAAGDRLVIGPFVRAEAQHAIAEQALPLETAASGEGWLIVNKPAGMPVHPLAQGETGTVLNAVIARYPQIHGVGEAGLRSGVVHRLDVETSGALLMATDDAVWQHLRQAFRRRAITKTYLAIVRGWLSGEGQLDLPLYIAQHRPAKVRVLGPDASPDLQRKSRRCTLRWRSRASTDAASLIEVDLGTGFLHQIRVMMAHLGHPLIGDAHYGDAPDDGLQAGRPMLHALSLEAGEVRGRCQPPADFQTLAAKAGLADAVNS